MRPQPQHAANADAGKRSAVIACVDDSGYQSSVCDHAAWFAEKRGSSVELLCTRSGSDERNKQEALATLECAAARLQEDGAEALELCSVDDPLPAALARVSRGADVVIVGRRPPGLRLPGFGFHAGIAEVVRRSHCAVCLAPSVFLGIRSALVLADEERPNPSFADAVATCPWLDGLVVWLATYPSADTPRLANALQMDCTSPAPVAACDLVVLSRREVRDLRDQRSLARIARALMASRVPVLVL